MLTLPNFSDLILGYTRGDDLSFEAKEVFPSDLLGPRRRTFSYSIYKKVERYFKGDEDANVDPIKFWSSFPEKPLWREAVDYRLSGNSRLKPLARSMIQSLSNLGSEEGYFWLKIGDEAVDISAWRRLSVLVRGLEIERESKCHSDPFWPEDQALLSKVRLEIEALERLSAELSLALGRDDRSTHTALNRIKDLLSEHPLGQTRAGEAYMRLSLGEPTNGTHDLGLRLALTSLLWQFLLIDHFMIRRDTRADWPVISPISEGDGRKSASAQWAERLVAFTQKNFCEKPSKRRGKPSGVTPVAKFLVSHQEDGRSPRKRAELLNELLTGRKKLTATTAKTLSSDLSASIALATAEIRENDTSNLNERALVLELDGFLAGLFDCISPSSEDLAIGEAAKALRAAAITVWPDLDDLTRAARDFLRGGR